MATAIRPRRLTARERMALTPAQEIDLLVAEQAADDTYRVNTPSRQVSLDSPAPSGDGTIGSEMIGRDPWDLVDAVIDLSLDFDARWEAWVSGLLDGPPDPAEVAYRGDLVDNMPPGHGLLDGIGLIDVRDIPHATAGGYQNHRCRCSPCTVAWAAYKRERRIARKAAV